MNLLPENNDYKNWLSELKRKIKNSQIKAALKVNNELIALYWEIGKMIVEKQENAKWGSKFIEQAANDLKTEFPDLTGFSKRNLYSMRQFYLFYNEENIIVNQLGSQLADNSNTILHRAGSQLENTEIFDKLYAIPWRHHVLILQKIKKHQEAFYYIEQTIENAWSRSVLEYQIETNLYKRHGKAISNFKQTLPEPDSDLAQQILKDPYNFDFLTLSKKAEEKELENKLIENITKFLLELGKGFAYMGRQFLLKVGSKEFKTDLLFYHTRLHAYIIIELKMKEFKPEFAGKLNFYVTAVNELVKSKDDKPTIGILLCKNKDDMVVDFSLKDINKPIGVSEFTYKELPEEIRQAIPTENELKQLLKQSNGKTK
ncbi:MAG: hypothetical protein B6D61_09430 [Bacteroidetes bacterium 4484_249]|nr:MAG: hypothetical protein B6D61_09430 [Bacteroidetes bacterium 4484_249]